MAGIVAPNNFPIRDPKSRPRINGRVVNPVGYAELGGMSGPSKWPNGNQMRVEKPTDVRGAHSSAKKDVE